MPLIAVTRDISPALNRCELSFHVRQSIDISKATAQHENYRNCLVELGAKLISLPAEPALPDSMFVEDAAVVTHEVAVITRIGAVSRREEGKTLAPILCQYRSVHFLSDPATLDGGDVLRIGRRVYVGLSRRTNGAGVSQLAGILEPYGYHVQPVQVRRCLHLKSACSVLGNNKTLLINPRLIDPSLFAELEPIIVPEEESTAANVLSINEAVIMPANFPKTRAILESHGFRTRPIDVSELQKAEAGVTCCSLIFEAEARSG